MYVERLDESHDLTSFRCGVEALDVWLRVHALENQRRNLSRSFVLIDGAQVIGYYSLTMGGVSRDELPRRFARGLPDTFDIGMVLVARLAISVDHQGSGLGRNLLVDAVVQAAAAGEHAAARFIAVDPIDDRARSFYAAFGFRDIPGDGEEGKGRRMYIRLDEAVASFGIAGTP
ncbi:MAG TPA: GNAT family N-acetyltransferase [Acidimicrobiales bacterium]|nr:GNAT family N-acetyltransferase [Acidimicrobiales bacterium]